MKTSSQLSQLHKKSTKAAQTLLVNGVGTNSRSYKKAYKRCENQSRRLVKAILNNR